METISKILDENVLNRVCEALNKTNFLQPEKLLIDRLDLARLFDVANQVIINSKEA